MIMIKSSFITAAAIVVAFLLSLINVSGQTVSPCSCSPLEYTFILNLDLDCNTNDLNDNPGIVGSFALCPSEDIEIVTSIQLLELNTTLQVINQCTLNDQSIPPIDAIENGSRISFRSILDPQVPIEDQLDLLPIGIQIQISGTTNSGDTVTSSILWTYTNDCNVQPLDLQGGESIGLITTVSYI